MKQPKLDCKCVLRRKEDGQCKARIVVRGFFSLNHGENPTANLSTIRLMLAIAAQRKLRKLSRSIFCRPF